jgi:hypothetical protein
MQPTPLFRFEVRDLRDALNILAAMITPALLISAAGTFILSTSNRLSRVVDRMRVLAQRIEDYLALPELTDEQRQRAIMTEAHLDRQRRRLKMLQNALTLLYITAAIFICTSVSIGVIYALSQQFYWIPVVLGLSGAALMFVASILLINEARQAVHNADEETEYVLALAARRGLSADPGLRPPAESGR